MSPIPFLIYINRVFNKVAKISPLVILLSFVEDLGFLVSGSSVKEIVKAFEKIAIEVIVWGILNVVTYDTSKMEAVFFSRSHQQRLNKQLWKAKIKVGNKEISFNKEVIQ